MALVRRKTVVIGLVVAALLLLLGWAAPIYASAHPAVVHTADSTNVVISVTDAFVFTPSDFEVTPGQNVTITLESLDSEAHTLTMSPIANYSFTASNWSTNTLLGFFAAHHPIVNLSVSDTQGSTDSVSFQAPPYGVYEFVCLEAGHFQAGMWGDMGSGVAVGPPAGPGIPVALYIIVGVIVTLVVIAMVLGFVVGKREGAKYEMPPERLGYPEPRDPTQNPPTPLRPPTGRSPPPGY